MRLLLNDVRAPQLLTPTAQLGPTIHRISGFPILVAKIAHIGSWRPSARTSSGQRPLRITQAAHPRLATAKCCARRMQTSCAGTAVADGYLVAWWASTKKTILVAAR